MAKRLRTNKPTGSVWRRVARFERPPELSAARALLKLQFAESDRARMHELVVKARAGTLSLEEEQESVAYEQLGCLLDILHSQARQVLKARRPS